MLRTLFFIPPRIWGVPVFGFGWMLIVWGIVAVVSVTRSLRQQGWSEETRGLIVTLVLFGLGIAYVLPWIEIRENGQVMGLAIRGYGVFFLLGIVSGIGLAAFRAQRTGVDPEIIYSLAAWTCGCGIVGARLFFVVMNWHQFQRSSPIATLLEILKVSDGGLVVYGSFIGGILGLVIFAWRSKQPTFALMDLASPSLMLGVAFGRLGCLMNGCCFGGVCLAQLPSIQFPQDSPAYRHQADSGLFFGLRLGESKVGPPKLIVDRVLNASPAEQQGLKPGDVIVQIDNQRVTNRGEAARLISRSRTSEVKLEDGRTVSLTLRDIPKRSLPVHPVQVYSSVDGFLLCMLGLALMPFRKRDGEVTAALLALYAVTRFIEEMVRDDQSGVLGTPLSIGQIVSIGMIASMFLVWIYLRIQPPVLAFESTTSRSPGNLQRNSAHRARHSLSR